MKNLKRLLRYCWIFSLWLSPLIGLFSILIISYIEIGVSIDWEASFTGKKIYKKDI
jgi:hypothetical protein